MAQNAASLSGNLVSTSAVQVGGEDSYEASSVSREVPNPPGEVCC